MRERTHEYQVRHGGGDDDRARGGGARRAPRGGGGHDALQRAGDENDVNSPRGISRTRRERERTNEYQAEAHDRDTPPRSCKGANLPHAPSLQRSQGVAHHAVFRFCDHQRRAVLRGGDGGEDATLAAGADPPIAPPLSPAAACAVRVCLLLRPCPSRSDLSVAPVAPL